MMDSIMEDTFLKVQAEIDEEKRLERDRAQLDASNSRDPHSFHLGQKSKLEVPKKKKEGCCAGGKKS